MAIQEILQKNTFRLFIGVEKRFRFVISAFSLAMIILLASFFEFNSFIVFIPVLIIAAYFFTYFSLLEGLDRSEWLLLFIMPVFFTISFYLFYFLFPVRWLTRVPFIVLYGISIYAILLTSNIFNVGVEKNLQLLRAAFSVNYFYQSILVFLLTNVLLSFKQTFFVNGLVIFIIVFLLATQLLWTVKLEIVFDKKLLLYGGFVAALMAELTVIVSFISLQSTILSLFLTACYYSFSGLMYHYWDQRLFKNIIREYLFVIFFVSVLVLLSLN